MRDRRRSNMADAHAGDGSVRRSTVLSRARSGLYNLRWLQVRCASQTGAFHIALAGNWAPWFVKRVPLGIASGENWQPCPFWSEGLKLCVGELGDANFGSGLLQLGVGAWQP